MACCWVGLECPLRLVFQCLLLRVVHWFTLGSTGVPRASDMIGRFGVGLLVISIGCLGHVGCLGLASRY